MLVHTLPVVQFPKLCKVAEASSFSFYYLHIKIAIINEYVRDYLKYSWV